MTVTYVLAALVGAGGLAGSLLAFLRLKPERESIIVTAAQGAVVIQSGVLDDLADELRRTQEQFAELESDLRGEMARMNDELNRVTEERDQLAGENASLKSRADVQQRRIDELESKVKVLESNGD